MKRLLPCLFLALCVVALYQPAAKACDGDCAPAKCSHDQAKMMSHPDDMVSATGEKETALDPVCGMVLDRSHAADQVEYQGKTYYFCRKDEKELFLKDPQKYLKDE